MVVSARHFSSFDWYRVEARCAECQSPSELKLVGGIFLCSECRTGFRGGDLVGCVGLGEGSEVVSSTPPARPHSGVITPTLFPDRIVSDDTIESGGKA